MTARASADHPPAVRGVVGVPAPVVFEARAAGVVAPRRPRRSACGPARRNRPRSPRCARSCAAAGCHSGRTARAARPRARSGCGCARRRGRGRAARRFGPRRPCAVAIASTRPRRGAGARGPLERLRAGARERVGGSASVRIGVVTRMLSTRCGLDRRRVRWTTIPRSASRPPAVTWMRALREARSSHSRRAAWLSAATAAASTAASRRPSEQRDARRHTPPVRGERARHGSAARWPRGDTRRPELVRPTTPRCRAAEARERAGPRRCGCSVAYRPERPTARGSPPGELSVAGGRTATADDHTRPAVLIAALEPQPARRYRCPNWRTRIAELEHRGD